MSERQDHPFHLVTGMRLLTENMKTSWIEKGLFTGAGSATAYLFGVDRSLLVVLVLFVLLDYMTGITAAAIAGELSSRRGFRGILRKVLMFVPVVMAVQIDRLAGAEPAILTIITTWALIGNEGVSIIENLAYAGVPIPRRLQEALAGFRREADRG